MADYYPLLAKAVAALAQSSPETRQAVYERARKALFNQLRNLDPPVPENVIDREAQALERAVARLETEIAAQAAAGDRRPLTDFEARPAAPPVGAPPSRLSRTPIAPNPNRASRAPLVVPQNLKVRPPNGDSGARRFGRQAEVDNTLGRDRAEAYQDRDPPLPMPVPPAPRGGSPRANDAFTPLGEPPGIGQPEEEKFSSANELAAPQETSSFAARKALRGGFWPDPRHLFAKVPVGDREAAKRIGIVAVVVGCIIGAIAIAAYKLRDRPEDLVLRLPASTSAAQGEAAGGGKLVDRVDAGMTTPGLAATGNVTAKAGTSAATPAVPVARRAALLMEAPEERTKVKTLLGTVVWRMENISNGSDDPLGTAVHAEIEIPDQRLHADMLIEKNFDKTLPASHTIKLRFSVPADAPLANLKQANVLLRKDESPSGDALKSISVPVTDNTFLVGLSRGDAEAENLELMRSREWFDIPLVLADGHIAKLTFEKGPSGRNALDDAMASWKAQQ
ncbi:MAG TPA: hypothetical protein VEK34_03040 [Methylocella sp.]|nr:hypothetical protein [Methylocella sp.]